MLLNKEKARSRNKKGEGVNIVSYLVKSRIEIIVKYESREFIEEKEKEIERAGESYLETLVNTEEKEGNIIDIGEFVKLDKSKSEKKERYIGAKNNYDSKIIPYKKFKNYSNAGGHRDSKSGAYVFYVPSHALPSGNGWRALGMYDPKTHSIYVANDLSSRDKEFVYHHEVAHALGEMDEDRCDNYAAVQTGYRMRA